MNKMLLRTIKALSICSKIQDHLENNDIPSLEQITIAIKNPYKPGSSELLAPFLVHCREYPSRETFFFVETIMKRFTVIDNYHEMEIDT